MNDYSPCPTNQSGTTPLYSSNGTLGGKNPVTGIAPSENGMQRKLLVLAANSTAATVESNAADVKSKGEQAIADFKSAIKTALQTRHDVAEGKAGKAAEDKIIEKLTDLDDVEL
jgi:hypothetical protein